MRTPGQGHRLKEDYWPDLGIGLADSGKETWSRGRGRGRTWGNRSQRRAIGSRVESGKKSNGTLGQGLGWKGKQRGGRKRGRRSTRSRQKPAKRTVETGVVKNTPESLSRKYPRSLVQEAAEDATGFQLEGAEPASSSGRFEYDDLNVQESGDEYEDMAMDDYASGFNGKSGDLEGSDYNVGGVEEEVDGDDDEEEERYDGGEGYDGREGYDIREDEDEQGDFDVDRYIDGDSDEEENRVGEEELNMELGQGTESTSSDYSE